MHLNKFMLWLILSSLSLITSWCHAEITVAQPLSFGKIAVTSNATVSTTAIRRNGSQYSTNKILIIEQGVPAEVIFENFPPYQTIQLSSSLPVISGMGYPGTAQFHITALDIPVSVKMDNTGRAVLVFGATLATSGDGAPYYSDAAYTLYIPLELTY